VWEVTVIRQLKYLAILATIAVAVGGLVYGDDDDHWSRRDDDRGAYGGYNQQYYDRAYRDGLNQGQYDRSGNRRYSYKTYEWRRGDSDYRNAYRSGYDAGYNGNGYYSNQYPDNYPYGQGRGRDRDRDDYPYGNSYPNGGNSYPNGGYGYPNGGYGYPNGGYSDNAYAQGIEDGRVDGRNDMMTGHSYRPTQDDNYKHADRGYDSRFGNKNAYKQTYRSGYLNGYEQGYRRGR